MRGSPDAPAAPDPDAAPVGEDAEPDADPDGAVPVRAADPPLGPAVTRQVMSPTATSAITTSAAITAGDRRAGAAGPPEPPASTLSTLGAAARTVLAVPTAMSELREMR